MPVDYDKPLREDYLPAQLTAEDYPNLISASTPVGTIAAEAVLASYNWQPGSDRYRRLALLVEFAVHHIGAAAAAAVSSEMAGASPLAPVAGWTRFEAAQDWIDRTYPTAAAPAPAVDGGAGPEPIRRSAAAIRCFASSSTGARSRQKANVNPAPR